MQWRYQKAYFWELLFHHSVASDCLRPHGLQNTRLPCPSLSRSRLLKLMSIYSVMTSNHLILCHPLSSCYRSFPATGSFPMSRLFTSSGQIIGASASVLPENIQGWFPLGWTGWVSLLSKGLSSLLQHHSSKASILPCSAFFMVQFSHLYMTIGKSTALTIQSLSAKRYLCFVIRCLGKVN